MMKYFVRATVPLMRGNRVIWVHMGPQELTPQLPDFEWISLPPKPVALHKRL